MIARYFDKRVDEKYFVHKVRMIDYGKNVYLEMNFDI
jgi:hypothetical protein